MFEYLTSWYEEHVEDLRRRGIAISLQHGTAEADKMSAWIDLESAGCLGQVVVWETGEIDLRAGPKGEDELVLNEHLQLKRPEQLDDAIERVVSAV